MDADLGWASLCGCCVFCAKSTLVPQSEIKLDVVIVYVVPNIAACATIVDLRPFSTSEHLIENSHISQISIVRVRQCRMVSQSYAGLEMIETIPVGRLLKASAGFRGIINIHGGIGAGRTVN